MEDNNVTLQRSLPRKFRTFSSDGMTRDPSFVEAHRYHAQLGERVRSGVGLLLSGPNGTGKSGVLAVIHRYAQKKFPAWKGYDFLWMTARDIAQQYNYGRYEEEIGAPVDTILNEARWLVVDELGRDSNIQNHDRRMHTLLQRRHEAGRVTHFTTNLSLDPGLNKPGTIRTVYGEGFWSLLHEACVAITVSGPDRRKGE